MKKINKEDFKYSDEKKKMAYIYIDLVEIVRCSRKKEKSDIAFNEIINLMKDKINHIVSKFSIPGFSKQDVYQEALFALRFKAIKDYDSKRSNVDDFSPFDNFAILCIRRHLSTTFKSAFKGKSKVLNSSVSIDHTKESKIKGTGVGDEEDLLLSNILFDKRTEDLLSELDRREYYKNLLKELRNNLSDKEKKVLNLYLQKNSYEDICEKMKEEGGLSDKNIKSVDNALSRIKTKAKKVKEKYDERDK